MSIRVWACVAFIGAAALPLQAAEPKPPEAKASDARPADRKPAEAKPDSAEAAAAMERARRQAANPLRVILEASKVRRRSGSDEPVPVAASVAAQTALPAAAAATPAPPPAAPPVVTSTAALESKLQAPTEAVAALPGAERVSDLLAQPAAPAPVLAQSLGPAVVQPKLREMVDPVIPPRVLDEIGRLVEVQADLTLRPDGTVAAVTLLPPVPRQLVRYLTAALERWRFEPLPATQVHRVQLVFNDQP